MARILSLCERIAIAEDKILTWGDLALAKFTSRLGTSPEDFNDDEDKKERLALHLTDGTLFRPEILRYSAQAFPQELPLDPFDEPMLPLLPSSLEATPIKPREVYDPRWVYPVLGLLLPHARVDFRKLVHTGIFSFVLAGLSSHEHSMREAAYTLLATCHALFSKVISAVIKLTLRSST